MDDRLYVSGYPQQHGRRRRLPAPTALFFFVGSCFFFFVCFLSFASRSFCFLAFLFFCSQALQLKPNYPKVLLRKARLHKRLSQWNLAIKVKFFCFGHLPGVYFGGNTGLCYYYYGTSERSFLWESEGPRLTEGPGPH